MALGDDLVDVGLGLVGTLLDDEDAEALVGAESACCDREALQVAQANTRQNWPILSIVRISIDRLRRPYEPCDVVASDILTLPAAALSRTWLRRASS